MKQFNRHSHDNFSRPLAASAIDRRIVIAGGLAAAAGIAMGRPADAAELDRPRLRAIIERGRTVGPATAGDPALGSLTQLPGTWKNEGDFEGHGWNMIALPYKQPGNTVQPDTPDQKSTFRLLLNQFNETLQFKTLDTGVPNRGAATAQVFDADQHLAALQYIQDIQQIESIDFPATPDTPDTPHAPPKSPPGPTIHHEPGLFLNLLSQTDGGPQIGRLATIPHGDSVLALGAGFDIDGPPSFDNIGDFSPLPVGVNQDVDNNPYLAPYKNFKTTPFKGLFDPTNPIALLKAAIANVSIKKTTVIVLDTTTATGGISNIPFVVKQANATAVRAVFWVEELTAPDSYGQTQFLLQYAQRVLLDFFPVPGQTPTVLIRWPHITVNTMKLATRKTS